MKQEGCIIAVIVIYTWNSIEIGYTRALVKTIRNKGALSVQGLKSNANADKLFERLLSEIEEERIDTNQYYTLKEIAAIIPFKTSNITSPDSYNYALTSMFSGQSDRDYFIYKKPKIRDKITEITRDPNRNNYSWSTDFGNERVKINPKYLTLISTLIKIIKEDIDSEQSEEDEYYSDGAVTYYSGKRYERNPANRSKAIEIHGLSCVACGFNFEEVYGERGKDFIEVHHIKPLSTVGEEVFIDPKEDLVPVCSNCHRMIHRRKDDVLTLEELKALINVKKL